MLKEMIKNLSKMLIGWLVAFLIGFILINALCFVYKRQAWWLDTPNGASVAVREPNSLLVNATEGFSISKIDKNGYSNPDKKLADNYVLMMGASHSVGKEVAPEKKYSVLVNNYFASDDLLHTYNIALEGDFLPTQIKHFKAGVQAFPNSSAVTIEIVGTDYSIEELKDGVDNQVEYDKNDTVEGFYNLSKLSQIKKKVRGYLPLWSLIENKIDTYKNANTTGTEYTVDYKEYKEVINEALALMRSEYDKPIVFIYHPKIEIKENGSIELVYSKTWDIFKEACENNDIDVIDSGEDILKYYENNSRLPYGFSNTTIGTGHLNETGHEMLAKEIIDYLEEIEQ